MKVLHEKHTNRMQIFTTVILVVVIAGLVGGLFLVRQSLDIRKRAAGPSCLLYDGVCSWTPVSGVTNYRIVVTGSDGTTQEFTSAGSSITFAGKPGTSYTCRVTATEYQDPACGDLPSGEGTGFCPSDSSIQITVTVTPTARLVTATATPPPGTTATATPRAGASATPTSPVGGSATTPPVGGAAIASPTPTSIIIQKSTTASPSPTKTPTPTTASSTSSQSGSTQTSGGTTAPTTATSLPQSGLWEPSLIILGIGLLAILIPLVL